MTDYRDPKVTKTSSGMGKWIAIAVAILLAIALIAWLLGAFNADEPETVPVVTEQEAPVTIVPEAEAPAATAVPEAEAPVISTDPAPVTTEPTPIAPVAP